MPVNWKSQAEGSAHREEIFNLIAAALDEGLAAPSARSLAPLVGVTHTTVNNHIDGLVKQGRLVKVDGRLEMP